MMNSFIITKSLYYLETNIYNSMLFRIEDVSKTKIYFHILVIFNGKML